MPKREREKPKPDPLKRPVDVFAGKGSLADKLRKRRRAIESGDPTGGQGYTRHSFDDKEE